MCPNGGVKSHGLHVLLYKRFLVGHLGASLRAERIIARPSGARSCKGVGWREAAKRPAGTGHQVRLPHVRASSLLLAAVMPDA